MTYLRNDKQIKSKEDTNKTQRKHGSEKKEDLQSKELIESI